MKFASRIYDFFSGHKTLMGLLMVALTAILVCLVLRLRFSENISDFLPLDKQEQEAMEVYQNISGAGRLYILFNNPGDADLTGLNTAFTFHHALNNRHYAATSADVLQAEGKAFTAMRYADGQPACVAYKGDYRCLTMGFPFECIKESTKRKSVMKALVRFLTD